MLHTFAHKVAGMKKESLREKFQLRLLLTFTQPANHCACWIFKFGKLEKSFPTRAPAAQMFDAFRPSNEHFGESTERSL